MAVAIASSTLNINIASTTTTNCTLPSGSSVGDLVILLYSFFGNANESLEPSGSEAMNVLQIYTNWVGTTRKFGLMYKELNSTDISNGYVQVNSNGTFSGTIRGHLLRITGGVSTSLIDTWNTGSGGTSPTFNNTATPLTADSLLIMYGLSDANTSISGYGITTSNPSWTELVDTAYQDGSSNYITHSIAYANRPEVTATGDSTFTVGSGSCACALIVVQAKADASISPSVMTLTAEIQAPVVSAGANVSTSVIDATVSVVAPTITTPAPKYLNTDKNSSTWLNPDKS